MKRLRIALLLSLPAAVTAVAPEHDHGVPEKLGTVHFETSCAPSAQQHFDHALALLHSFAYDAASKEFGAIAAGDTECAMAGWGIAMSLYHQLWSPPDASALDRGREALSVAQRIEAVTPRERAYIAAAAVYFSDADPSHHASRAQAYEQAMQAVASEFPQDDEAQIFHALSLVATAPPTDRSHARQKQAVAILEPIYRRLPDHPGVAHYLIHACDSSELAQDGLPAARAYARIAPSAPHALHMPSHIFTRLGLWDESIESNEAARRAARQQGDRGEELHAMDYLTYAYLQRGRADEADRVVAQLRAMGPLLGTDFKAGYAATAMPVRVAIERERWSDAAGIGALPGSLPHVAAIAYWAQALGHAHTGQVGLAATDAARIDACEAQARAHGDAYWATQIGVLAREARAWSAAAAGHAEQAVALLRSAADSEDSLDKLPVTPGPIVPAREQLGRMLLELRRPADALQALSQSLADAPGRLAGLQAAIRAAESADDATAAASFRRLLPS